MCPNLINKYFIVHRTCRHMMQIFVSVIAVIFTWQEGLSSSDKCGNWPFFLSGHPVNTSHGFKTVRQHRRTIIWAAQNGHAISHCLKKNRAGHCMFQWKTERLLSSQRGAVVVEPWSTSDGVLLRVSHFPCAAIATVPITKSRGMLSRNRHKKGAH